MNYEIKDVINMDITKDLKRLMNKEKSANEIVKDIYTQQHELMLKSHLFKVLSFINKIEEILNNVDKNIRDIHLEILYVIDDDDIRGFTVNYSLHDTNNNPIPRFKYPDLNKSFKKAFLEVKNIDRNLTNEKELEKYHIFEVDASLVDNLLNLFLNKELKTIFEYNKMQLELDDSNKGNSKKIKM